MDAAGRVARGVDRVRPCDDRAPHARADPHRGNSPKAWHLEAELHSRDRPGPRVGRITNGVRDHDARAPGLADERCDRADARPRVRDALQAAGVGDRCTGEGRSPAGSPRFLPTHGWWRHARRGCGGRRRVGARGGLVRRAALAAAVGGVARGGSVDQPPPAHRKDHTAVVRGYASPAINRPTDMAVLRDVRRPRRARPASR